MPAAIAPEADLMCALPHLSRPASLQHPCHPDRRGLNGWVAGLVIAVAISLAHRAAGQEALRTSLAGQAAAESRHLQQDLQHYTFKRGDFRMLLEGSLGLEWNDNVTLQHTQPLEDFIIQPHVGVEATYPITAYNTLNLTAGFGYDKYINHDVLSRGLIDSGSQLSFGVFVKDVSLDFHERFQYSQDSASEAAVANTGSYGTFQNTAGVSATWDLQDATLTLGYDHQNSLATSSQYSYLDRAAELVVARAGFKVRPRVTTGLEGTASFTRYDQQILNDNNNYSGGGYVEWRPGQSLSLHSHAGYTLTDSHRTSTSVASQNQTSWYGDFTLSHQPVASMSYALSAGHELRAGIESDQIEDWYARPGIQWSFIRNLILGTSFTFEKGNQKGGKLATLAEGSYTQYGGELTLSATPMKRMSVALNYRLLVRSSDVTSREYTQNQVGLVVSYIPQ